MSRRARLPRSRRRQERSTPAVRRAQSNVVGVALLLGVTVVALAGLTASVGSVVDGSAASADAARVAAGFDDGIEAVEATGRRSGRVSFTEGELTVVDRELRVLLHGSVVSTVPVDALVYRTGHQRVIYLAGAVVRDTGASSSLYATPPVTASRDGGSEGVLVVGAPTLNATGSTVVAGSPASVALRTDVSHDRTALGSDSYAVAVETSTPGPWVRFFRRQGASVDRRDLDGDGVESVVASYPGVRETYLVVHDLRLEVDARG